MAIVYHTLNYTWIFFFTLLLPASCENVVNDEQMRTRGGVSKATKKQLFDSNAVEIPKALRNLLINSPDKNTNREEATVCYADIGRHKVCPDDLDENDRFNSYKQLTVEGSTYSIYCCQGPGFHSCCNLDDFRIWNGEPATKTQSGGKPAVRSGNMYEKIPTWKILVIVISVILAILIIIEPIVVCCIAGYFCIKSSQTTGSTIAGGFGETSGSYSGTPGGYTGTAGGSSEAIGGSGGTAGTYSGTTGSHGGTDVGPRGIGESNGGTAGGYSGTDAAPTNKA